MDKKYCIRTGAVWRGDWEAGWVESNRRLYDYELVFFSRGRCRVLTEDKAYCCDDRTVIIIPPDFEHCSVAETMCTRWCVHFDWFGDCPPYRDGLPFVYSGDKTAFDPALTARRIDAPELVFPLCLKLDPALTEEIMSGFTRFFGIVPDQLGHCLQRDGIFMEILGKLIESAGRAAAPAANNPVFLRGKRLLDQRYGEIGLELRRIAGELKITPNHLNKLFRQSIGLTPSEYLQTRRMLHAEKLLKTGTLSIKEVAEQSGFAGANYFIRCFKARKGVTPYQYRHLYFELPEPPGP